MKSLLLYINIAFNNTFNDVCSFFSGLFFSIIGFFVPVKNIVHFLLLLFLLDVIFGVWNSKKIKKDKFQPKLIWEKTMPRLLISLIVIICLFIWDTVYSQNLIHTYNIIGWFISGVLIYSIGENAYNITKWQAINVSRLIIWRTVKKETGIDISEDYETETKQNIRRK